MIQIDSRIGGQPRYILTDEPVPLMLIPDEIRKCVAFVGLKAADGSFRLGGTVFFVSRQPDGADFAFSYMITARHVITKIKNKESDVFLRLNMKDGSTRWFQTDANKWIYHPDANVDVAILKLTLPEGTDHLFYAIQGIATDEIITRYKIGVGDEVFLTGLFTNHYGQRRNIPIVRVGNIAAMPEELVKSKYGLIEAYLIEARSIGGLSGSPVFVHLGVTRYLENAVKFIQNGPLLFLLGLIHGHWDVPPEEVDTLFDDAPNEQNVNMGIAIVIPATKILEVINQPMIKKEEQEVEEERHKSGLANPDSSPPGIS